MVRFVYNATFFILAALASTAKVESQTQSSQFYGEISGDVRDQHGDLIVGAQISLTGSAISMRNAVSDARGRFRFDGLRYGNYTLKAATDGFAPREETLNLTSSSASRRLTITLYPAIIETLDVSDDQNADSLDPHRAAGAQTLKEEQIRLLPDDPEQFQDFLQLLSTSSGSAPGQATVTVDGFTHEGLLPPKSAIREVRINSNIFSAEYDKPPYRGGRIDVYTKPGASAFQTAVFFNFNDAVLNARDAFAPKRAPVTTRRYGFQFGGPIAPGKSGFLIDFEAREINETTTVNAIVLDRQFQPTSIVSNAATPKLLLIGSARADWQVHPVHTFVARYDINRNELKHQNVGGFNLPDRATDSNAISHSLRFSETAIINKRTFNEARIGLTFQRTTQQAASNAAAITVLGAFSDGGASMQSLAREEWRIELTDNLSIVSGNHSLKLGAQITGRRIDESRSENFNGAFVFGGAIAPQLDKRGEIVKGPNGPILVNISGLEQYRRTLLGLPGGTATRFSINRGNPLVSGKQWTLAGFAQDEWHLRNDLLLSLGLRYEAQTNPADRLSIAPRIGIGYSPDRKRRWVLRARAGFFYDRIDLALPLEAHRLDGRQLQQIIIDSPSFPDPFKSVTAVDLIPTIRRIDTELRPPVSFQTQIGFERQMRRGWKIEIGHYTSRGWASLLSRNINAPLLDKDHPDPLFAPRPFGRPENILQFESSGSLKGQVLFVGVNQSSGKRINIFSGYLWFDFHTNADFPFLLPQSSYDLRREWARPMWQARHRAFLVALVNLPWKLRTSSEFNLNSGLPYNITTGRDNNGDGNFNDRPSLTLTNQTTATVTPLGALDPGVISGSLPRNAGVSPLNATLDFNLSRTFEFGPAIKPNEKRYQMTLNLRANNLLNRANLLNVDGVLNSPFFGHANTAAPARRIEMGVRFNF